MADYDSKLITITTIKYTVSFTLWAADVAILLFGLPVIRRLSELPVSTSGAET